MHCVKQYFFYYSAKTNYPDLFSIFNDLLLRMDTSLLLALADKTEFDQFAREINERLQNETNRIEIKPTDDDTSYQAFIDTKYYKADVLIHILPIDIDSQAIQVKLDGYKSEKINIEGFLVLMTQQKLDQLLAKSFISIIRSINESESSDQEIDNPHSRLNLYIEHSQLIGDTESLFDRYDSHDEYLRVNLHKETTDETDEEFEDLVNCLLTHSWSSSIMNESTPPAASGASSSQTCEQQEESVDSFGVEELISNLHDMKKKAEEMSFEERKKYAEQVVLNFWKSIGGDPAEIGDLDDDDD